MQTLITSVQIVFNTINGEPNIFIALPLLAIRDLKINYAVCVHAQENNLKPLISKTVTQYGDLNKFLCRLP